MKYSAIKYSPNDLCGKNRRSGGRRSRKHAETSSRRTELKSSPGLPNGSTTWDGIDACRSIRDSPCRAISTASADANRRLSSIENRELPSTRGLASSRAMVLSTNARYRDVRLNDVSG